MRLPSGWAAVERRLGISLPGAMKRFFARPRRLKHLRTCDPFPRDVWPQMPTRFLPVFSTHCGDFYGLYFPRGGAPAFVTMFDHEASFPFPSAQRLPPSSRPRIAGRTAIPRTGDATRPKTCEPAARCG